MQKHLAVVLVFVMLPVLWAQNKQTDWQNLSQLQSGQKIQLIDANHQEHSGAFSSFTDQAIVLHERGGDQTIQRANVPRLGPQRLRDFSDQLKVAIELEEKLAAEVASNGPTLTSERVDLEKHTVRLADAIGQHGYSPVLSAQLSKVETRMAEIDQLLAAKPAPKFPKFTDQQIAEFLRHECQDFCDALTSDPEFARQEIQKRIKKLVLTPKDTPEGPVLEVSGDVGLLRTGHVLVESSIQRTSQQYIGLSTPLAGIILNPAPLLGA